MKKILEKNVALVLTIIVFTVMLMSSCSTSNYACGITPLNKQYRMTCR